MEWQLVAVGLLVAGALAYLVSQAWRTWKGSGRGCGGCRCAAPSGTESREGTAHFIPAGQLTLRRPDAPPRPDAAGQGPRVPRPNP